MVVLVTSFAVLVIIGAARGKILMSKPPGLGSSSPSFFSGGGKRYGGSGGAPPGTKTFFCFLSSSFFNFIFFTPNIHWVFFSLLLTCCLLLTNFLLEPHRSLTLQTEVHPHRLLGPQDLLACLIQRDSPGQSANQHPSRSKSSYVFCWYKRASNVQG